MAGGPGLNMAPTGSSPAYGRRKKYVPDLRELGVLFEGNYLRLTKLLRLLGTESSVEFDLHASQRFVARVGMRVVETGKYTQTLYLEQLSSAGRWVNDPQMTVRLYHDAGVAEVISCHGHRRIEPANAYPNRFMHHPDEKSQLNRFLAEWLTFCLRHGCRAPVRAPDLFPDGT